jgi:hypothetical protein
METARKVRVRDTSPIEFKITPMSKVPDPPSNGFPRRGEGRMQRLWRAIKEQPRDLADPPTIEVSFKNNKQFTALRGQLRAAAKKEGLMLLTSRTADNMRGWFWIHAGFEKD